MRNGLPARNACAPKRNALVIHHLLVARDHSRRCALLPGRGPGDSSLLWPPHQEPKLSSQRSLHNSRNPRSSPLDACPNTLTDIRLLRHPLCNKAQ